VYILKRKTLEKGISDTWRLLPVRYFVPHHNHASKDRGAPTLTEFLIQLNFYFFNFAREENKT